MIKYEDVKLEETIYVGLFLQDINEIPVEIINEPTKDMHMTLEFYGKNPCTFPKELFGKEVSLLVDGAGFYEEAGEIKNQGLRVADESLDISIEANFSLRELFKGKVPHITLTTVNGGKPMDTYKCVFEDIKPFVVNTKIGAFCREEKI